MTHQKQIDFITAWTNAAKDLGLVIQPSFTLLSDSCQPIHCTLLLENFGSKNGTVIFTDFLQSPDPTFSSKGYFVTILGEAYSAYHRELFVDTLNDWGYFGDPNLKPDWFRGHYWGQSV